MVFASFGFLATFVFASTYCGSAVSKAEDHLLFSWLQDHRAAAPDELESAAIPPVAEGHLPVEVAGPALRHRSGRFAPSRQQHLAFLEVPSLEHSGLEAAPTERLQLLADIGHLEAQYEQTKAVKSNLQWQLLDEAARLQESEHAAALARRDRERAEGRARLFESGLFGFVVLASMMIAGALLYSPKRKPAKWTCMQAPTHPMDGSSEGALCAHSEMDEAAGGHAIVAAHSEPQASLDACGFQSKVASALKVVEQRAESAALDLAVAKSALTALQAAAPAFSCNATTASAQHEDSTGEAEASTAHAALHHTADGAASGASAEVEEPGICPEAAGMPRAAAGGEEGRVAAEPPSSAGGRCEYFTLADEPPVVARMPEEQASTGYCCLGPSPLAHESSLTAEDSWWSHESPC